MATASPAGLSYLVGMLGVVEDAQVAIAQPGRAARPAVGQAGGAAEGAHRAPPSPAAADSRQPDGLVAAEGSPADGNLLDAQRALGK